MALAQKKPKPTRRPARTSKPKTPDLRDLLLRIDEMIRELQSMRQQLAVSAKSSQRSGLTRQLFGVLGHGTWDEYDMDLHWNRFAE